MKKNFTTGGISVALLVHAIQVSVAPSVAIPPLDRNGRSLNFDFEKGNL
jgi:hypothetical protein